MTAASGTAKRATRSRKARVAKRESGGVAAALVPLVKEDPMLELPPRGAGPQPAIAQLHFRGRSLHLDIRMKVGDKLVGWTFAIQRPGAVPPVATVEEAERIADTFSPQGNRYTKPIVGPNKVYATPKDAHDVSWLRVVGEEITEGEPGATANEPGVVVAVDKPSVEFGLQSADHHEYFLSGGRKLNGILHLTKLPASGGREAAWVGWLSRELLPGVLRRGADMPADGYSALPRSLERVVPAEMRYWESAGAEARKLRDALVASGLFSADGVKLVGNEFRLTTAKRFLVESADKLPLRPTTLAASLAAVLPRDREYRHPFLSDNWGEATSETRGDVNAIIVLSPPSQDVASPLEMAQAVAGAASDWLIESDDTPAAREAFASVGRAFKLAAAPDRLFCASFSIDHGGVEWIDALGKAVPDPVRDLEAFGPPEEWSGAVAAMAGAERRKAMVAAWEAASAAERKRIHEVWSAEMDKAFDELAGPGGSVARAKLEDREVPIFKLAEEHYVLGVVLEPNDGKDGAPLDPDSQKDVYSLAEIRQAAHRFMEEYRNLGLMHRGFLGGAVKILESYLAPCDCEIAGQRIRAGTWLLAIRVLDPRLWEDIKEGKLTGFSIGGSAIRKPVQSAS